jgi:PKD domain
VTGQRTRFGEERPIGDRRPGWILGRRFAFVLVVVYFAFAGGVAASDQSVVVSATVYPSGSGSVTNPTATLSGLNNCQQYPTQESGWSPITLYGPALPSPFQPALGASWELSTVLTCGMNVSLNNVTGVQVYSPRYGFETPLTKAELTDASQYHDPAAPDALPVISSDEGQNTYVRPWRGGKDQNANDQVVEDGSPVTIVVYENGAELTVVASASTVSTGSKHKKVRFSATVRTASGSKISTSALAWSWNFGDGGTSSSSTPEHSFVGGKFPVTVQVTDRKTAAGGTDTIDVNAGNPSGKGNSPTGPNTSSGDHPGGAAGGPNNSANTGKSHSGKGTTTNSNQTTTTPTSTGSGGTNGTGAGTTTAPVAPNPTTAPPNPAPRSPTYPHARVNKPPAATGPLVAGRLISDVIPVPANDSPLVKVVPGPPATAPAIRPATSTSFVPALGAGIIVVLLLGLGAGNELRGRRDWRTLLPRG